jgi:cathepsin L
MKLLTLAVLAVSVYCAAAASILDSSLDNVWLSYKQEHGKVYGSEQEETSRRLIWEKNVRFIQKHNVEESLGQHTYTVKMNKYGDLTNKEFRAMMNGFDVKAHRINQQNKPALIGHMFENPTDDIPASVDWRTKGYVNEVKDQGQCGSCWSFSAVASLEGQHFKKTGKLVSLSEQNLVDCSSKFGNQGCNGGLMDQAFSYIKANKGIDTEQSYPYEATDGKCRFKAANVGATDTGFVDIKSGDEKALTEAIATVGPIAVAIDASQDSFQFYSSGVYVEPNCSSTELDHGVAAVGYGALSGKDYYIVRNSWGPSWGDKGYIMMARNHKNVIINVFILFSNFIIQFNRLIFYFKMCGIATAASYPTV